jgi:hypothetical protein
VTTKDDLRAALRRGDDLLRNLRMERLRVEPADHVEMDAGWGLVVQEGGKLIDGLADEKPMTEEACELAGHGGYSKLFWLQTGNNEDIPTGCIKLLEYLAT